MSEKGESLSNGDIPLDTEGDGEMADDRKEKVMHREITQVCLPVYILIIPGHWPDFLGEPSHINPNRSSF